MANNQTKNSNKNNPIRWIIKSKLTGEFLNRNPKYTYTKNLKNALLMPTRNMAREAKEETEIVCKVKMENNQITLIGPEWM
jgi:hypothetical protein